MSELKKNRLSSPLALSFQERMARLQLYRSENVGPSTFYHLLHQFGSAEKALETLPTLAFRGGKTKPLKIFSFESALKEIEETEKYGAKFVIYGDEKYPQSLINLGDAPPVLTIKGDINLLNSERIIGVVGARNASLIGKKIAYNWSQELGQEKYVIVSGLARGIDTAAHKGSLETGTIAMIAGGINQVYPLENRELFDQVAEQGLIIAESPFDFEPQASLFPRRNRIISALSQGVIVIEAAKKSGSLTTARFAADQNREVFVVPGSPLDLRYEGSNKLIKDGANLITCPQDLMDVLNRPDRLLFYESHDDKFPYDPKGSFSYAIKVSLEDTDSLELLILEHLSTTPIPLDDIIRMCKVDTSFVMARILELELAGKIIRHPNNMVSIAV